MLKLKIDLSHTFNHYDMNNKEVYDILKQAIKDINNLYERLDDIEGISDEEKKSIYDIIDILWSVELEEKQNDNKDNNSE